MPKDPNSPKPLTNEEAKKKKASADAEMDRNMQEGAKKYADSKKKNTKGYAKGGKVRGCGIARRGLGRVGSRGR